jgi:hypothetical protein
MAVDSWDIRLKPYEWVQSVEHYPSIDVEGVRLIVNARIEPSDLTLSSNQQLHTLGVNLQLFDLERTKKHRQALVHGFGTFTYYDQAEASPDDNGQPFIGGWLALKKENYTEVWDQIRAGGYSDCRMTVEVSPVECRPPQWIWNVAKTPSLFITSVSVSFTRRIGQEKVEERIRRRSFWRR